MPTNRRAHVEKIIENKTKKRKESVVREPHLFFSWFVFPSANERVSFFFFVREEHVKSQVRPQAQRRNSKQHKEPRARESFLIPKKTTSPNLHIQ